MDLCLAFTKNTSSWVLENQGHFLQSVSNRPGHQTFKTIKITTQQTRCMISTRVKSSLCEPLLKSVSRTALTNYQKLSVTSIAVVAFLFIRVQLCCWAGLKVLTLKEQT